MTTLAFTLASIEAFCIRVPVKMPIKVAFGTFRDRPLVLLRVVDTAGAEGWGLSLIHISEPTRPY